MPLPLARSSQATPTGAADYLDVELGEPHRRARRARALPRRATSSGAAAVVRRARSGRSRWATRRWRGCAARSSPSTSGSTWSRTTPFSLILHRRLGSRPRPVRGVGAVVGGRRAHAATRGSTLLDLAAARHRGRRSGGASTGGRATPRRAPQAAWSAHLVAAADGAAGDLAAARAHATGRDVGRPAHARVRRLPVAATRRSLAARVEADAALAGPRDDRTARTQARTCRRSTRTLRADYDRYGRLGEVWPARRHRPARPLPRSRRAPCAARLPSRAGSGSATSRTWPSPTFRWRRQQAIHGDRDAARPTPGGRARDRRPAGGRVRCWRAPTRWRTATRSASRERRTDGRADRPRGRGAGAARRGQDQRADRGDAVHVTQDGERPRLAHHRQARRRPTGPRLQRRPSAGTASVADVERARPGRCRVRVPRLGPPWPGRGRAGTTRRARRRPRRPLRRAPGPLPSSSLRTHPTTPRRWACSCAYHRNATPCTCPVTRAWIAFMDPSCPSRRAVLGAGTG